MHAFEYVKVNQNLVIFIPRNSLRIRIRYKIRFKILAYKILAIVHGQMYKSYNLQIV